MNLSKHPTDLAGAFNAIQAEISRLAEQAVDEHQRLKLGRQQATYAGILAARSGIDIPMPPPFSDYPALIDAWGSGIEKGLSATIPEIRQSINARLVVKRHLLQRLARTYADHVHEHLEKDNAA
jgi:hypothetical protein